MDNVVESSSASFFKKRFRYQMLCAFTVHTLTLAQGIGIGWLSPALKLLQSEDSPLDFEVTLQDASWIGSLFGLGSLTGNIFMGTIIILVSRKWSMYLAAIPPMLSWIFIYAAVSVEFLYCARFFTGMTSGSFYIIMGIFLSEIADRRIRGALGGLAALTLYIGILCGYVLASHLPYHVMPCIIIIIPIIYLLALIRFPETPQYLLRHNKFEAAETSYRFYNNIRDTTRDNEPVAQATLRDFEELKNAIIKERENYHKVTIKDFFAKKSLLPLLTTLVIILLSQYSGAFAMVNFMAHIFEELGSVLDSNTSTIIVGVVQIVGSLCLVAFVDFLGRKVIILISACGLGLSLLSKGLYASLVTKDERTKHGWVPLMLMSFSMFFSSLGVTPSVLVMIVETLPAKIRSIGTSISMAILSVSMFVILKVYLLFMDEFGVAATMFATCSVCFVCSAYLAIFFKEMKGKAIDVD